MDSSDRERLLDALHLAARDAAETPLTAEEDGKVWIATVVSTALDRLASEGLFPSEREARAALAEISGYGLDQ